MEEVFDSEAFVLRYDEQTNSCVFTMKTYGNRDDFRTPVMHAVELIKKHKCKSLIVDDACEGFKNINEADLKWIKSIIIPKLRESLCESIYFVVEESEAGTECSDLPYSLFRDKFKVEKVVSEQFALMMISNHCEVTSSSDISSMTRAQALEYMGLPANSNDFAIDEKFWKLTKQYRGDNTPEGKQKIADLSTAYDIATGRRDERVLKEQYREEQKKFFGKTGDEWRNYFSYTWYRYLIVAVILLIAANIIYTVVNKPGYDCGYVSIGHFGNDSDYVEKFLVTGLGYENPLVSVVDIVVPNDQGQSQQAYADQTASTLLLSGPNVLVFDEATLPYYYSNLTDLTTLYQFLRENLTDVQMSKLRPVYMSERDAMEIMLDYERTYGADFDDIDEDLDVYSDDPVMIGIMLTDPDTIETLGYINYWPSYEPSLVFTIYSQTMDFDDSEIIIMQLLRQAL